MSETNTLQRRREAVLETAKRIDETASAAMVHFSQAGSMAAELQVAQAMYDLRAMLTPEVMTPIMNLMDTDLGFRTDKDPKQLDRNGKPNIPYHVDVVRDVVIEAKLRGFHTIGNEFNIIAGRMYAAKNGFRRKLTDGKSFPGLTGFRDTYEVPRLVGDKGAIVKCKAVWTLNGKPDSAEFEFAIKVNSFMGADAIVGKAERKLCKRVHDLISGVHTPDGDVDDNDLAGATDVTPPKEAAPPAPGPKFAKKEKAEAPKDASTARHPQPASTVPADEAPAPGDTKTKPNAEQDPGAPFDPSALTAAQTALQEFVVTRTALDFDTFKRGLLASTWFADRGREDWNSFADVPDDIADRLVNAPVGFKKLLHEAADPK